MKTKSSVSCRSTLAALLALAGILPCFAQEASSPFTPPLSKRTFSWMTAWWGKRAAINR